ncbi:MAG: SDR family oxidoreductase [Xanthobacteraceae bacterium]|nr:SDR family oxidoreductase [Xanthobacteraceae bacterium]PWB59018.1 MAG: NAD-dependent dehydratase [Bradyrhizobiaceae bacterium]
MPNPLDRFRLDDQVAVITGGARGIGRATAELFAAAGAKLVLADRDGAEAARTAAAIGRGAEARALDVTDEAAVEAFFADVATRKGRLDVLVNNAGASIRKATLELPKADWDTVVAVNMTGVFLCTRAAARQMIGRGGTIVNVASIMGLSGGGLYPNASYQATKGAVVNMTRAFAVEWAREKIRVNAVAPTWVRTGFIQPLLEKPDLMTEVARITPMGRIAEPEEVAAAILFLASPAASMTTGHVLAVDGGFLAQ